MQPGPEATSTGSKLGQFELLRRMNNNWNRTKLRNSGSFQERTITLRPPFAPCGCPRLSHNRALWSRILPNKVAGVAEGKTHQAHFDRSLDIIDGTKRIHAFQTLNK